MAIAVGATSKGRTGAGSSQATTAVTTQAAGSTILLGMIWTSAQLFTSIADSKSNSYTQIGTELAFGTARARFYYKENATGGASHTATVTVGGSSGITIFLLEITGGLITGILDQNDSRNDAASPFTLAAGLTTTQAAELLAAFVLGDSGSNPATHAESGLGSSTIQTAAEETNGSTFWTGALATAIKASTGTFNPSWTETGATSTAVLLATFKEASVAGGARLPYRLPPRAQLATKRFERGTKSFASAVAADVSVALTGASFNFAHGTLTPNISLGLAGSNVAFSAGAMTSALSVALAGSLAAFSAGALTPNTAVPLGGTVINFSTGTLSVAASDVTVALTGSAMTFLAGSLTPDTAVALAGQAAAFSAGAVSVSISVSLAGKLIAFQAGTLGSSGGDPVIGSSTDIFIIRARRRSR